MKARSFLPFPAQFLHQIADPSQASEKRVLIRSVSDPDEPVHSERRSRRYGNVFLVEKLHRESRAVRLFPLSETIFQA